LHELEKVYNLSEDFSKMISKLAGFKSVKDYFDACTVNIKDIRIPTFFLSSLDD